jgi:3-oxoadipate enol-lactonase/4-carboxymuconolactone decarboxylase
MAGVILTIKSSRTKSMKLNVNGININYPIDGPAGAPWVTMSNSLATTHRMCDAQMDAFATRYRLLPHRSKKVI